MKLYTPANIAPKSPFERDAIISIACNRFSFSAKLIDLLKLKKGDRIAIGEEDGEWYIGKHKDGFLLSTPRRNQGLCVHSKPMCDMLRKRLKVIHKRTIRVFVEERSQTDGMYQIIMAAVELKRKAA